ncbi:GTPase HflX [Candidatus Peregrinibacteria bacterium]|nr:GTPase HflX [Candidatus Peregrinibacteria bacterium]
MKEKRAKAILIDVIDLDTPKDEARKRLGELENLVNTYGSIVVVKTIQRKGKPDYETYIGKGKVEEIRLTGKEKKAEILIVNNILKPRQVFNLQEILRKDEIKVWDRIDLILKIFDKHAKSTEAKLQIELAGIRHMGPRIYGMGIELSRQAGAMGLRAGAGEANIEIMKRHLRKHELSIQQKLKHYDLIRAGHRKRRRRQNLKTVALVGYTNAGKSSVLNALTNKGAYVADQLFATLDTRVGKLYIKPKIQNNKKYVKGMEILISDTIGFIQDLPPSLIQAFKSTLAETVEADLILHIIDITDSQIHKKIKVVEKILDQLGLRDKPKLYVFNKIDLIPEIQQPKELRKPVRPKGILRAGKNTAKILGWESEKPKFKAAEDPGKLKRNYEKFSPVFVSANEKINLDKLIEKIEGKIKKYSQT